MRKAFNKLTSALLLATLLLGITLIGGVNAQSTVLRGISEVTQLGNPVTMPDVTGTTFKVAIVVEDVANFYGFDIQLNWTTDYIRYVGHTVTVPAENFPAPQPPSPYGGTLYSPTMKVKEEVNEAKGISGADPNTMAWFVYASMAPANAFNGNGTIAVFTFRVADQPWDYESPVDVIIHFVATALADVNANPISHTAQDVVIPLYQRKFSYPPLPLLMVNPALTKDIPLDGTFQINVNILGEGGSQLSSFWDVAGFDIVMHFDPTLIEAQSVAIDPDGWFAGFWPNGIFTVLSEINNTEGTVHVAFLGIPGDGGVHTPPFGSGKLFTVTFKSIFESTTYPPPSTIIGLRNPDPRPMPSPSNWPVENFMVDVAGFPHPDYPMPPWNGQNTAVPIPHVIQNATYIAKFKPPGRWIDVYTQYPEGFNGKGPGVASDAFGPQNTVRLYAWVTYNLNPVQQKLVTFEISHGEFHWFMTNTTDENGIAWVQFGIPWPCDNPEGRVFGTWNVIATVDIRDVVVNDTLSFEVGYLIKIVNVEPQPDSSFAIGEPLQFKVTYESISHQDRTAYITITVYDDLEVPIAWTIWGPITVHYGTDWQTITLQAVPKHTFVGMGTVYTNMLTDTPTNGGVQYCPVNIITIGLTA